MNGMDGFPPGCRFWAPAGAKSVLLATRKKATSWTVDFPFLDSCAHHRGGRGFKSGWVPPDGGGGPTILPGLWDPRQT